MIGKRVGMLVVIERIPGSKLVCACDCGAHRTVSTGHFNAGSITSCGCHVTRHGHSGGNGNKSREYICYHNMIARCCKPSNKRFKDYGAKGITVCSRWLKGFTFFLEDMGLCPSGMTIDRRDNRLPYTPENCRWATRSENQINRGVSIIWTVDGKKFSSAKEASISIGISTSTVAAWCKGRTAEGRTYPPKPGCSFQMVYGEETDEPIN